MLCSCEYGWVVGRFEDRMGVVRLEGVFQSPITKASKNQTCKGRNVRVYGIEHHEEANVFVPIELAAG